MRSNSSCATWSGSTQGLRRDSRLRPRADEWVCRARLPELPTGAVTFLFSALEGSTTLWEQQRDAMRHALMRHDALVEQIVAEHGGHVVRPRGDGDSRFAVLRVPPMRYLPPLPLSTFG